MKKHTPLKQTQQHPQRQLLQEQLCVSLCRHGRRRCLPILLLLFLCLGMGDRVWTALQTMLMQIQQENKCTLSSKAPKQLLVPTADRLQQICRDALTTSNQTFPHSHSQKYIEDRALTCVQLVRSIHTWTDPYLSIHGGENEEEEWAIPVPVSDLEEDSQSRRRKRRLEHASSSSVLTTQHHDKSMIYKKPQVSLQRLANKFKLAMQPSSTQNNTSINTNTHVLQVLVLGGSMTFGAGLQRGKRDAWPAHLNKMLQLRTQEFIKEVFVASTTSNKNSPPPPVVLQFNITNLAMGGATAKIWTSKLSQIQNYHPDLILLELAINDACNHDDVDEGQQRVSTTSKALFLKLLRLPSQPAIMTVELFRTAYTSRSNALRHCPGHALSILSSSSSSNNNNKNISNNNSNIHISNNTTTTATAIPDYYYCPQWWSPPDWRESARDKYHVPMISYRDAVWPRLASPPKRLDKYWDGLAGHPSSKVHHLVATTVYFAVRVLWEHVDYFVGETSGLDDNHKIDKANDDSEDDEDDMCGIVLAFEHQPQLALQESDNDNDNDDHDDLAQQIQKINLMAAPWKGMHWVFGTDDPFSTDRLDRYGWIYEQKNTNHTNGGDVDAHVFRLAIKVGKHRKVVITHLASYDPRMATAKVWFSRPLPTPPNNQINKDNDNLKKNMNVFPGAPTWNISSWHADKTSIPEVYTIKLPPGFTKDYGLSWSTNTTTKGATAFSSTGSAAGHSTISMTLNIAIIPGSSMTTIDKFKLLSVETC